MKRLLVLCLFAFSASAELRLELVRESLTGTHCRYREYTNGIPHDEYVTAPCEATTAAFVAPFTTTLAGRASLLIIDGRVARRAITNEPLPVARDYDVETGALIRTIPLYFDAKPARVFDPSPVVTMNDPSLRDRNDAANAVPEASYRVVELESLSGPHVAIVDRQAPHVPPSDPNGSFYFDRSQSGFEDVNAYFHVDRNQRWLQSLGYTGGRQVVAYAIEVDTHAAGGSDNSFYLPSASMAGRGTLYFGTGGTDDAEDADLLIHEYGHAVQDWIAPGTFAGTFSSEARALSEGFCDYWAFSAHYARRLESGRDRFCFADWDARCSGDDASQQCGYPAGADCLRRLDAPLTMSDYDPHEAAAHRNGQIWSAALASLFLANVERYGLDEGRRITDTLVIEALFGTPPNPTFGTMAGRIVAADRLLFGGAHAAAICDAMTARGIVVPGGCDFRPRGEFRYVPSSDQPLPIPENNTIGVTSRLVVRDPRAIENLFVRVDLAHTARGDLRIVLIAPDGTRIVLQQVSFDRTRDLRATFGLDAAPLESLDVLRARNAAGVWSLEIADMRALDRGTLQSWGIMLQLAGDRPLTVRPAAARQRQVIPVVTHVLGANGTRFATDLRVFNNTAEPTAATLVFTPTNTDGRTSFSAVRLLLEPRQVVAFGDVVASLFNTTGSGSLEILGPVLVSSRTYNEYGGGTVGQDIPAEEVFGMVPSYLALENSARFRSNVGFTETSGSGGNVDVLVRDGVTGAEIARTQFAIAPLGHLQMGVPGSGESLLVEVRSDVAGIAYGSVIDNVTGDPRFVQSSRIVDAMPAISATGANGTLWQTDVVIVRPEEGTEDDPRLIWTDAHTGETLTATVPAPPLHESVRIEDVVATLFRRPGRTGTIHFELAPGLVASARIATRGTSTSVQRLTAGAIGTREILHVENTGAFRTNIGLIAERQSRVVVTIYDSAGVALESREVTLEPRRLVQFPVNVPVTNGRATVDIVEGLVRAYGSLVDNVTGDATFIVSQPSSPVQAR